MNKFRQRWTAWMLGILFALPLASAPIAARADNSGVGLALLLGGLYVLGRDNHNQGSKDCDYDSFPRYNAAPAHYDTFPTSGGYGYQYDSYATRPTRPAYDQYGASYGGGVSHYDTFPSTISRPQYDDLHTYDYDRTYGSYSNSYNYAPPPPVAAPSQRAVAADRFRYYQRGEEDQFRTDQAMRVREEQADARYVSPAQERVHAARVNQHLQTERQAFAAQQSQQQAQFSHDFDGCP